MAKKRKESVIIPKKALYGIAPAIAILAVLLSRHKPGEAILFVIGIIIGIIIAKGFFNK